MERFRLKKNTFIRSKNAKILYLFSRKMQSHIDISVQFCYNVIIIVKRSRYYGKKGISTFIKMEK